ncbi:MAG: DUF3102 domain-containing protein, partial [Ruminococcaceae bacterium]|nr:DUF3102 domain-containing protein [Oscillospiraceae bacterium]
MGSWQETEDTAGGRGLCCSLGAGSSSALAYRTAKESKSIRNREKEKEENKSSMSEVIATYRDINSITAEIRTIKQSVGYLLLNSYIELGRRLVEAKELLPHGEWGAWLRDEAEFSQSTANNMMNIFREYGADQASLFGEAKSQTLGNLTYSKAVALLQVPAEEREEF